MSAIDDTTQSFDVYSRLFAIKKIIGQHPSVHTMLDVGGHPGMLARSFGDTCQVFTMDLPAYGCPPYVRGGGETLPFASQSVDAIVASDVVEHIPTGLRATMLAEMVRVARELVIVSGPWATAGVAEAEAGVCELRDKAGLFADRWLEEHRLNGLPEISTAWDFFAQNGWSCQLVAENDLIQWFSMFAMEILTATMPDGDLPWKEFMPAFNTRLLRSDTKAPAYRHILIAARHKAETVAENWQGTYTPDAETAVVSGIHAIAKLFGELLSRTRRQAGAGADVAYINQLEMAVNSMKAQLEERKHGGAECVVCKSVRTMWEKCFRKGNDSK